MTDAVSDCMHRVGSLTGAAGAKREKLLARAASRVPRLGDLSKDSILGK